LILNRAGFILYKIRHIIERRVAANIKKIGNIARSLRTSIISNFVVVRNPSKEDNKERPTKKRINNRNLLLDKE
jgi:hypothetical protein